MPQSAEQSRLREVATANSNPVVQLNLAWLLYQSPRMLPIPGPTSIQHLEGYARVAAIMCSAADPAFFG